MSDSIQQSVRQRTDYMMRARKAIKKPCERVIILSDRVIGVVAKQTREGE